MTWEPKFKLGLESLVRIAILICIIQPLYFNSHLIAFLVTVKTITLQGLIPRITGQNVQMVPIRRIVISKQQSLNATKTLNAQWFGKEGHANMELSSNFALEKLQNLPIVETN